MRAQVLGRCLWEQRIRNNGFLWGFVVAAVVVLRQPGSEHVQKRQVAVGMVSKSSATGQMVSLGNGLGQAGPCG